MIVERTAKGQFVLIAEIGVNYYDIATQRGITAMEAAMLMIREAKDAGVHAVKFQTYKAETLAVRNSPSYWDTSEEETTTQFELFRKFDHFGKTEYQELSRFCAEVGIEFFSTAFDFDSADYLDPLMDVYKISSSDLNNVPFIRHLAKKNKPILLSVGASDAAEIDRALEVIRECNNQMVVLLHCVLEYPTPAEHANLNKITGLRERYPGCVIGYSDHTKPTENCDIVKTAYNLGATVIEKHFTLDKTLPGNDHYHAMDPDDARRIIAGIDFIDKIRGSGELHCLSSERVARQNARRSVVAKVLIPKGTCVTEEMLTYKRPGQGLPPDKVREILGMTAVLDIAEDAVLSFDMFIGS